MTYKPMTTIRCSGCGGWLIKVDTRTGRIVGERWPRRVHLTTATLDDIELSRLHGERERERIARGEKPTFHQPAPPWPEDDPATVEMVQYVTAARLSCGTCKAQWNYRPPTPYPVHVAT